ncbi:MAG: ABC transporter substrate-binding protein, partial [Gammaproteobacteria bacterium]|nr:ABC transporter substrate-binding protein [Gammaproteobacteria bacterium]
MRIPKSIIQILSVTLAALLSSTIQAEDSVKVGMMLPATGTYARLGSNIQKGFKLYVEEQGGKLAGRDVEYVDVDSEANPSKAVDNVNKLIKQHNVDVLVGSVHSGVAMAMAKSAKSSGTLMIVPNAGANQVTGPFCGPNIFRTSFSGWQTGFATGEAMAEKGFKKVVTITWKYGAGEEMVEGFKEAFEKSGGQIIEQMWIPYPNVEFQAQLTQIAALKPDGVFAFFAGGGAIKFVKDYAAAGLKENFPLYGTGFLTDGTLQGQGDAAEGVMTALHYADELDVDKDKAFREAYAKAYDGETPDV